MEQDINRIWCGHCSEYVSKRTKRLHKSKFYNGRTKVWIKQKKKSQDAVPSFHTDYLSETDDSETDIKETFNNDRFGDLIQMMEFEESQNSTSSSSNSESSTELSESCEEWSDIDQEELLNQLNRGAKTAQTQDILENIDGITTGKRGLLYMLLFLCLWKFSNLISNNAFEILLESLKAYFNSLGTESILLAAISVLIPSTIYKVHKLLGLDKNDFERYIVCPTCYKLFDITICEQGGNEDCLRCDNIPFRKGKYGKRCNAQLVRGIKLKSGVIRYYPLKIYCFKSLINSLEDFLCRPGFENLCEEWRNRSNNGMLSDIYDGNVWKDFQASNARPFLGKSNNFAFVLNVDWFQPYERRNDISIGVIYMVLLNLPRHLRYKRENVFLIGIIPGLKKEPSSLNSFLDPLIKELKALWKGVLLKSHTYPQGTEVRAALLCAAADIPAARKLCGFLGHSAQLGCSKCMKKFPSAFGQSTNYGGFDRAKWPKRTKAQHIAAVKKLDKMDTKTAREALEKKLGYRYTKLLDLEYMDCVRFCIIDPMHNLFLGTAKHMWKIWIDTEILTDDDVSAIESRLEKLKFPSDVGRLPTKISSNWGGFTAQQWKIWTLSVSVFVLTGILPESHLKIWHSFVRACQKICSPSITEIDAKIADALFLKFATEFESMYGTEKVTPNIHLHCHLLDVILDYGSIYGFWLFSFERYNGLLGSICNNNRDIEIQLMREFLLQDQLFTLIYKLPNSIKESINLEYLIDRCKNSKISHTVCRYLPAFNYSWSDLRNITVPRNVTKRRNIKCLDTDDLLLLKETYQTMYVNNIIRLEDLSLTYTRHSSVYVGNDFLSSKWESRSCRSSYIIAAWYMEDGKAAVDAGARPCRIKYFIEHTLRIEYRATKHIFAVVEWFKQCQSCVDRCNKYLNPVTVWLKSKFEDSGSASYVPLQRFKNKFIFGECVGHETDHIAVMPLDSNYVTSFN